MKETVTIEEIDKLANLSKLSFTDEEKQVLVTQVNDIIEMLNGCDINDLEIARNNRTQKLRELREDIVEESMDKDDSMRNSADSRNGYFVVPKVVD